MLNIFFILISSYLLGSIPNAYIYCKIRGKDIRQEGSKNVGATNAARLFGTQAFIVIFILDAVKGFIPVFFIVPFFMNNSQNPELLKVISLIAVICGHIWTVFLNFKGGKGVATSTGGLIALMPQACVLSIIVFILIFILTRIVSLGSIVAALMLPVFCFVTTESYLYLSLAVFLALLIVFTHRANIIRLKNGTEHKFNKPFMKKKGSD